jgi:lysophospholipase L1-like esterase
MKDDYPTGLIGGINLGNLTEYLFFFANGSEDANWQGATKGFVGDVAVNSIEARERTSGDVPYAGTIYNNDSSLEAWQKIVQQNPNQAVVSTGEINLISSLEQDLNNAFDQINSLRATVGFESLSSTSLNGLDTQNGINETLVINVTSKLKVKEQIKIKGDAGDVYVFRWDQDLLKAGYQGQVKFESGGAIVPLGELKPSNFIHVAGDINASGGGKTPPAPYPQGPRLDDGTGNLIEGGKDFSGGGFFTGYWLTTGSPDKGETASLSNAIFVGGWYTLSDKFSLTSGTSGVYVSPNEETITDKLFLFGDSLFDQGNLTTILSPFGIMPYPPPFYSEGKAVNGVDGLDVLEDGGLVLGETIAAGLGVDPDSIIPRSTVPNVNLFQDNVNYAVAGATSGIFGSAANNLETFPLGLLSQVQTFKDELPQENLIYGDGILTAGSNDVLEVLLILPDLLETQTPIEIINNTATEIVDNIAQAIDILDDNLNQIVILGLSPIGNTPFAIKNFDQPTRDLLTGIAAGVNTQLIAKYDNAENNIEDVLVIDGFEAFAKGLSAWEMSLEGATAITDVSYLDDWETDSTLSVEPYFFADDVHPTNNANEFLANEIVPVILEEFPHFTFA